nr:hypothetical protein [Ardenticatenales bacterium]
MNLKKRWMMALAGTTLAVTLALGASATFAQEPGTGTATPPTQSVPGERGGHVGRGGPRGGPAIHEALAEALGISVE